MTEIAIAAVAFAAGIVVGAAITAYLVDPEWFE